MVKLYVNHGDSNDRQSHNLKLINDHYNCVQLLLRINLASVIWKR